MSNEVVNLSILHIIENTNSYDKAILTRTFQRWPYYLIKMKREFVLCEYMILFNNKRCYSNHMISPYLKIPGPVCFKVKFSSANLLP